MKVLNLRPSGAGLTFDVQVTPTVRLLQWSARRDSAGRYRVIPPTLRDGPRSAIVSPENLTEIAMLVEQAHRGGHLPHAINAA